MSVAAKIDKKCVNSTKKSVNLTKKIVNSPKRCKIPKNSILARNFSLSQGNKDKICPGQEIRETRTRFQSCAQCHQYHSNLLAPKVLLDDL